MNCRRLKACCMPGKSKVLSQFVPDTTPTAVPDKVTAFDQVSEVSLQGVAADASQLDSLSYCYAAHVNGQTRRYAWRAPARRRNDTELFAIFIKRQRRCSSLFCAKVSLKSGSLTFNYWPHNVDNGTAHRPSPSGMVSVPS